MVVGNDYCNIHGVTTEGSYLILKNMTVTENGKSVRGVLDHCYLKEPVIFNDIMEMVFLADSIMDQLEFPRTTHNYRSSKTAVRIEMSMAERLAFQRRQYMQYQKLKGKIKMYNRNAVNFLIRVRFRQNTSWQGELFYMEKGRQISDKKFRSIYELIRLLYETLDIQIQLCL